MSEERSEKQTEGVKTLLGDPKKAIIKLALPMILAMSIQTIYNLVDALWVSGLGPDALSAVGFFFPFFFMAIALATGLGIGGGAAISRRIGAKDKEGADSVGTHTFVLMIIIAVFFTIPFFIFARSIFVGMGAQGIVVDWATSYARILFAGTIIIFFTSVSNAVLRGEGDVKRAMLAMVLGGILNIILDPIMIYTLDFGVAGAAIATLISLSVSAMMLFYWLFIKKDTYLDFKFKGFKWDMEIIKDIFKVGLPASVQQLSMSFNMIILNLIIVAVAVNGNDGVAILSTGWRVSTFGILPLLGISTAVVSVSGAMYGQRNARKLKIAFHYAVKIGLFISLGGMLVVYIFAPQITALFTRAEDSARIADDLVTYFRITGLFFPAVSFGMLSGAMFQGTGKGMTALIITILRTLVLTPPLALIFAFTFNMGLSGVWWSIVIANITASIVAFTWARYYIRKLRRRNKNRKRPRQIAKVMPRL